MGKKRFRSEVDKNLFRVPIKLERDFHDWLSDQSIRMKLTGGYKLPKSYLIRAIINSFIRINANFENISDTDEIKERIYQKCSCKE